MNTDLQDNLISLTGRKFLLVAVSFATFTALLVHKALVEATYQVLVMATLGGYLVANFAEGWKGKESSPDNPEPKKDGQ